MNSTGNPAQTRSTRVH